MLYHARRVRMPRYRGQKVRYRRRGVVRLQLRQLLKTRAVSPYGLAKFTGLSRSEEHTSELQSQSNLVCRLLLEKKKNRNLYEDQQRTEHATSISRTQTDVTS